MPGKTDKRRGGATVAIIIVAIVVAIFVGYNVWYVSGEAEDGRPPTAQHR